MRGLLTSVLCVTALLAAPAHARNPDRLRRRQHSSGAGCEIRNEWNAETKHPGCASSTAPAAPSPARSTPAAPADIYFSANSDLGRPPRQKQDRDPQRHPRQTLFRNRIVLVAPASAVLPTPVQPCKRYRPGPRVRTAGWRSATRNTSPPAYTARQALAGLGLWSRFAHRTVRTQNVRLALALVQRGEAPLGIVYYTDAIQTGQVRIVATFNGALHAPVAYACGGDLEPPAPARKSSLAYLASDASRDLSKIRLSGALTPNVFPLPRLNSKPSSSA